jgi:hypothetical protein
MEKFIIFLLLISPTLAYSQVDADSLIKKYKLNFAQPDYPAFKSLGLESSNLLRPSNVSEFGVVASEFYNGNNLIIPKSFAMEVSPVLLMNINKMTLSEYQKNHIWKTSRFSLGTLRDSLNTSNIAIGYRISIINNGDLRTDNTAINELRELLEKRSKMRGELRTQFLKENNLNPFDITDSIEAEIDTFIVKNIEIKKEALDKKIKEFKVNYENEHWNAQKLDFAIALAGSSPDSLLGNVNYNSFQLWATYAHPIFKSKGQLLFGLNYQNYQLADTIYNAFSVANRNYFGNNKIKFFIEEQLEYKDETESGNLLINLGGELNLSGGLWLDLSAGLTKDFKENSSNLVSQFRFRYTIPDKN